MIFVYKGHFLCTKISILCYRIDIFDFYWNNMVYNQKMYTFFLNKNFIPSTNIEQTRKKIQFIKMLYIRDTLLHAMFVVYTYRNQNSLLIRSKKFIVQFPLYWIKRSTVLIFFFINFCLFFHCFCCGFVYSSLKFLIKVKLLNFLDTLCRRSFCWDKPYFFSKQKHHIVVLPLEVIKQMKEQYNNDVYLARRDKLDVAD